MKNIKRGKNYMSFRLNPIMQTVFGLSKEQFTITGIQIDPRRFVHNFFK
jgi:hypothetical protein